MNSEIKNLCTQKRWGEAIDLVSRIPPAPGSGKTEGFIYIGGELLKSFPESSERDPLLSRVIEGLLQLGDTEHTGRFVLGLRSRFQMDKFGETIAGAMRRRQDVAEGTEGQ